jgi:hypothetical protein
MYPENKQTDYRFPRGGVRRHKHGKAGYQEKL